ncbi:MAG: formimidoylglutamase, partial [Bacteroidia bacterium]|nr:formimidoylglutamase [Bacteroidia bacterium]
MSEIAVFFTPVDLEKISDGSSYSENMFGNKLSVYSNGNDFPELEGMELAFIGVNEGRRSGNNSGCGNAADEVRKFFYKLFAGSFNLKMTDLGNITAGHTEEDTYYALSSTLDFLIRKNIIPVIIGGGHDLTYAQFRGYEKLEQTINVATVDSCFDLGSPDDEFSNKSFLGRIILHQPNYLFNYSNIGYQTYLVDQSQLNMMNKLYFDAYRVGQVRTDITEMEPVIRSADMMTCDISAIKQSDAPGSVNPSPNGFTGEETCQAMMYAGLNDRLTSLGIYEYDHESDNNDQTAHLIAQMIWYFIEG